MEEKINPERYGRIAASSEFRSLMVRKKRFLLPMSLFFLAFYFVLPILTSYSTVLNEPAVGSISWAWVLAFAQFVMTWALCSVYTRASDRKSTRLNSSHIQKSRMPSSA